MKNSQWEICAHIYIKVSHLACIKYHLVRHRNSFPIISRFNLLRSTYFWCWLLWPQIIFCFAEIINGTSTLLFCSMIWNLLPMKKTIEREREKCYYYYMCVVLRSLKQLNNAFNEFEVSAPVLHLFSCLILLPFLVPTRRTWTMN